MKHIFIVCLALVSLGAWAQEGFPVNGAKDERPGLYAFTNATIYVDFQTKVENATLVIRDGRVVAVGTGVAIPKGATVTDLKGKYIYPALVEPYSTLGMPKPDRTRGFGPGGPQYESKETGPLGWNEAIKSTYDAIGEFKMDKDAAEALRKSGVGSALVHRPDGIVRGTSLFTTLSGKPVQEAVLSSRAALHYSFDKGSSRQQYPSSIMGMVALLRQTYYDAQWYKNTSNKGQVNLTLEAFNAYQRLPQVFEANGGKLRVLLADQIGDEFGVQYIVKGNGDEYQRLSEIKATGAPLIIPVQFPDPYDVTDPIAALDVSLAEMKHWELAPANAKMLAEAGIEFAFTTSDLKNPSDYWSSIRKTVEHGLSESVALKALTFTPARYYNMQNEVGALRSGMQASFFIASDNIFSADTKIHQTWVQGEKYEFAELAPADYTGNYDLKVGDLAYKMEVSGKPGSPAARLVINDSTEVKVTFSVKNDKLLMSYTPRDAEAAVRLSGWVKDRHFAGSGQDDKGAWITWSATRTGDLEKKEDKKEDKKEEKEIPELGTVIYPFVAYGSAERPQQETLLFRNATVWTLEGEGKLEGADVLVRGGKIAAVGKGLSADGARVIDATGKHLTPGIIDEHSHVALSGVNEGSHAITAEVRMYDAVDSEDIDIYRQLAGGVTAAQLLHGSANPVGGQSALVKFRWGLTPAQMKIQGADGYIKFALGENVKQSNWGDTYTTRFPQTRMGVEQVYVEAFTRAQEYGAAKAKYDALAPKVKASTPAPRKDLQLETLWEILNKQRFITCHSYVQSEINMLIKVAEQFNFRVNTFTHILEGYKVADKMAAHGVGGSTFSDWWAYKYEVVEAIPYNASLMSLAGVISAINSDDAEMARRLNQEAAKSVKYGGMSEVEALKMVTLNPAKLLHLDSRMGSIATGKDADLVLWTDHPLSIYAQPAYTLVDGTIYFSQERDAALRQAIQAERTRLINKMKEAKEGGASTQKPKKREYHEFHCEDIIIEGSTANHNDHE